MSLRELAERVLFARTLEAKLSPPGPLTDDERGIPIEVPGAPGRPPRLGFRAATARVPFPGGSRELESERARGVALHFFANHELLAMELMALVLLRFPDAPARFRSGVAHTLVEEQDHLRRYLLRMSELGVEMGEVPVSDFFWKSLAPMRSPLEYVAGMSLTFEQANLDFARYYEARFREVGDEATADLMVRVLEDEVRHVAHGLAWLKRWTPSDASLFRRHADALPGPLSLRRARGPVFCREERRAAGLPPEYIDALRVHAGGRGRRPRVWKFNPGAEDELAGRGGTRGARTIAHDLAPLLGFLAASDDVVRVPEAPTVGHLARIADAGFEPPRFAEPSEELGPIEAVHPWARLESAVRDPSARAPLAPVPSAPFAKDYAFEVEARLPPEILEGLGPQPGPRRRVSSRAEIEALLATGPQRLKDRWGASGRGQRVVRTAGDLDRLTAWLRPRMARGDLVAEPELDVCAELSLVLDVDRARPLRSVLESESDPRGQYRGHRLGSPWSRLPKALLRRLDGAELKRKLEAVGLHVAEALRASGHAGPAGVDVRVHGRGDAVAVQAIAEINPRLTMGHVAHALGQRLGGATPGWFGLVPLRALGPEPPPPTYVKGRGGFFYATDPARAENVVAMVAVGRLGEAELPI